MTLQIIVGIIIIVIGFSVLFVPTEDERKKKARNKQNVNTHNYKVAYDLSSSKYYIVNSFPDKDVPLRKWYGAKITFPTQSAALVAIENLNVRNM